MAPVLWQRYIENVIGCNQLRVSQLLLYNWNSEFSAEVIVMVVESIHVIGT